MVATTEKANIGSITQIIGPVIDAEFTGGKMPQIYNALKVQGKNSAGQDVNVTCEVQQLLGDNQVRAVAMSSTDGMVRGMEVIDTGARSPPGIGRLSFVRLLFEPFFRIARRSLRRLPCA